MIFIFELLPFIHSFLLEKKCYVVKDTGASPKTRKHYVIVIGVKHANQLEFSMKQSAVNLSVSSICYFLW